MLDYSYITPEMLTEEVLILSKNQPHAIYKYKTDMCSYVEGHAGSGNGCIFGQALQKLGVKKEELERFELVYQMDSTDIRVLSNYLQIKFDPRWQLVQSEQDAGLSWEVATRKLKSTEESTGNSDEAEE